MDNSVQIQIIGSSSSGKSTITQEVVDALRNLGFAVKWDVKPDYNNELEARKHGVNRLNCLEAATDKTTIVVKEINVNKDINASLNYRVESYTAKKK
jgi:molybdopterin-guanine dinucleotide biosynthesis protein